MPRAATTTDVFNAIAEPRRRQIIDFLAVTGERPVQEVVIELGLAQPAVSKHLGVLRAVGLVSVARRGKQRLYSLNPRELKAVNDWVKPFERYWTQQVDRIKQRAEEKAASTRSGHTQPTNAKQTPTPKGKVNHGK